MGKSNKTLEHMLLLCDRSQAVWFGCSLVLRIDARNITRMDAWLDELLNDEECLDKAKALIACILW